MILSLDTWRSGVALAAAGAGVDMVNDTWAGADPDLVRVAARLGAGYVISHTGGLPRAPTRSRSRMATTRSTSSGTS